MPRIIIALCLALFLMSVMFVCADALPSDSQQTQFYANVCDQATITVPDEIGFDVVDVTQDTTGSGIHVSATDLVLGNGNVLRIELKAEAVSFTAPEGSEVTWDAADVTWAAGIFTGGTGFSGTLESGVFHKIAESSGNPSELSCDDMAFTIKAKPGITFAGVYSLTGTWRFTSFTP